MAQSEQLAKMRAADALQNVTASGDDYLMHIGNYTTSFAGGSITATLGREFCKNHDLQEGDMIQQFFDAKTGALVIIPDSATDRCPNFEGAMDD